MRPSEIRFLKYWQKKYMREAIVVLILSCIAAVATYCFVQYWGFQLLILIAIAAVVYCMLKSLRDELQIRAETEVWNRNKEAVEGFEFDVGCGIDKDVLLAQDVIDSRQKRECFNVLKNVHYIFEEDVFYTEYRLKWFSIRNTAFRGVVVRLSASLAVEKGISEGVLTGQNLFIDGTLRDFLSRREGLKPLIQIMRLLHATKVQIVADSGELYFWVDTPWRLFYQFSLLSEISPLPFLTKVQQFRQAADDLYDAFNF